MKDLKSMLPEEIGEELKNIGEKSFRKDQIFSWLHEKKVRSCDEMTNLSLALRKTLAENYEMPVLTTVRMQESRLDGTRKYLFALSDGNLIESVLMRYSYGNSVCVSSQVGCRMGCRFCASTVDGLVRSLKPSEILEQIYEIGRDIGEPVNHVVVMGSGEPMDNYDNVVRFIRLLTHPKGANLSQRNITVSSCGLPEKIREFANEGLAVTLALSLHAPEDETRKKLLPVANAYALKNVIAACDYYFEKTGRRVTYEYALVRNVNDSEKNAADLAALLRGKNAHVNLIPVNQIEERDYEKPRSEVMAAFYKILEKNGINAIIRKEMGADIDGACGQLRRHVLREEREGE